MDYQLGNKNTMLEFSAAPIPFVKIGLIGLGGRGFKTLNRYKFIEGADIIAIADLNSEKTQQALETLRSESRNIPKTYNDTQGWQKICEDPNIDLVYICTEWASHTPIAVYAMNKGKHVAVEVPAATTIKECWQLIETSEKTKRHCFMLENCCYDSFFISQLEMVNRGELGIITNCEGAYLHDLRKEFGMTNSDNTTSIDWMHSCWLNHEGNPYPTHGIGPIGWLLNLHRGDRMTHLTSISSKSVNGRGKSNTSLIQTEKGKTILLKIALTIPQPYSRIQSFSGTKGYTCKYPIEIIKTETIEQPLIGNEATNFMKDFQNSVISPILNEGNLKGVPNTMNYAMDARLIYCLRNGLPLDIDIYDAAEWSSICELSELSARNHGEKVDIPDFTHGNWNLLTTHKFYQ